MEAPEKIYLVEDRQKREPMEYWYNSTTDDTKVEYARKDALIEKACKRIEHLLSGYIIRNFHFGDSYEIDTLIEDFKKYMERDDK